MKNTPETDKSIGVFDTVLNFLKGLEEGDLIYRSFEGFNSIFGSNINTVHSISKDAIAEEFWQLAAELKSAAKLNKLYHMKFRRLLSSPYADAEQSTANELISRLIDPFYARWDEMKEDVNGTQYSLLVMTFTLFVKSIQDFRSKILSLIEEAEVCLDEGASVIQKEPSQKNVVVRPASRRKTDIIKILSAMYDVGMFADAERNPLTNKQEMMEAFGEFFGEEFSTYSASLSQGKTRDERTFMKPFRDIEKEALRYFNEVKE
jgi:hypothetical protein